jgi:carboxypeptidase Taq
MESYVQLKKVMATLSDIGSATAIMGWDQETFMPPGAVEVRAEQMATLMSLSHGIMVSDETRRVAEKVTSDIDQLHDREQRVVRTFLRDLDQSLKRPSSFVEEMARTASLAQDAWKKARQNSDFSLFASYLQKIVDLKRQEAELVGYEAHPYDAMLDMYEPGLTMATLDPVFANLQTGTTEILQQITSVQSRVQDEVLYRSYNKDRQLAVASDIIHHLGFSPKTGRIDLSEHPFCTQFDRTDVRLTTRIRENDLRSCLFGLIHEAGHGMYEQGISPDIARTSSAQGASMGIHESQSLFWENIIARSEEFWHWAFPKLRDAFPDQLSDQDPSSFYRAINKMQPSLNRVESDELTYNLHIVIRYEIERGLMDGSIAVADVPSQWNERMKSYVGVLPPNDAQGCLQDVHWSFGGIGYFPSYSLGKLYAAMQWNTMKQDLPHVSARIADGDFTPILSWLRTKIHDHGRTETPDEIIQRVTGRPLTESDFLEYVGEKATHVYGL